MRFMVILLQWLFARKFGNDECGWETENGSSREKVPTGDPCGTADLHKILIPSSNLLDLQPL
jgi:hypothetical protein